MDINVDPLLNNEVDCQSMERDGDQQQERAEKWQMKCNLSRYEVLQFARSNDRGKGIIVG